MRIELVYPHTDSIHCPDAIGRHLALRLGRAHSVRLHDWNSTRRLEADPESVLLGHPHPAWGTTFRRAAARGPWKRVVMMCPFNGDPAQVGWLEPVLRRCDAWLAICGPWWFDRAKERPYSAWFPRMRRLDLAVDRGEYPRVKGAWAPAGKRRFLYVGHEGWPKNTDYLSAIARARPQWDFAWAGKPRRGIPGVAPLGWQDFSRSEARDLIAGFDILITVGTADANPATLLEGMAWGLIPVCTPQSGYAEGSGLFNVPLDDLPGALDVLDRLQAAPSESLDRARAANDADLERRFHWDRVAADVEAAITDSTPPAALERSMLPLRARWAGPFSPLSPRQWKTSLKALVPGRRP